MRMECARSLRRLVNVSASLLLLVEMTALPVPDVRAQQAVSGADSDNSAQVMTRGPVHEAFAAPLTHNPQPGPVVTIEPPKAVEELPPDQKPVGANIQWIPGYWQWDEGRNDFLWISGVWRDPPPGREWVPGYWNQVQAGFQWVPGAWMPGQESEGSPAQGGGGANAGSGQSVYLPAPPATLEVGPNSPSPSGQVFWSPGSWSWQGLRFVWRPGFWAAVQPGWVWMPAQFVWTPSGYVFVQGYWDLPIATRGLLFAPVYYPQPIYLQPGYVYTPSVTIMSSGFTANLFVQPAYSHYCFGDYYAQSYMSVGIYPWFSVSYSSGPRGAGYYDPFFSYYSVVNVRNDPRWVTHVREEYIVRRDNIAMRPPRTLVEQTRLIRAGGGRERVQVLARPVGELAAHHPGEAHAMRLERIDAVHRQQIQHRAVELNNYREKRMNLEHEGAKSFAATGGRSGGRIQPRPMNLAHSPVSSRPAQAQPNAERRVAAEHNRQEQVARAGDHAASAPRRNEAGKPNAAGHPGGQPNPRQPAGRIAERPGTARAANPQLPPGAQHPGARGNAPQPREGRPPNHAPAERRVPPHPTPVQRERRDHAKG